MSASSAPIRVVVAKVGLDGHDRGAKVVARALRDAGMEVVYTGLHNSPEQVVATALAEDADAIGLSILSGAHMTLFPRVLRLLDEAGAKDIVLFGGGIIPDADATQLREAGVAEIFGPGASTQVIAEWVREHVASPDQGRPAAVLSAPSRENAARKKYSEQTVTGRCGPRSYKCQTGKQRLGRRIGSGPKGAAMMRTRS